MFRSQSLVRHKAAKLKLWVEQNWLVVRREKPNGYWDWQIVLALVADKNPPQVMLGDRGAIEIKYGQSFIREAAGSIARAARKKNRPIAHLADDSAHSDGRPESVQWNAN